VTTTIDKQCLLQGKAGPVLSTCVLFSNVLFPHITDSYSLIAICTESVTSIISLEPTVQILFRMMRETCRPGVLPCAIWRSLQNRNDEIGQTSSHQELQFIKHPVLVSCRGNMINFIQVAPAEITEANSNTPTHTQSPASKLHFQVIGHMTLEKEIKSIEWIGGQILVAITENDQLHVIDPFRMKPLEQFDVHAAGIVSHNYFQNPQSKSESNK
jgi:hypothetical protein